ncbi:MAG: CopD family protein [Actinomycetota bacterium]
MTGRTPVPAAASVTSRPRAAITLALGLLALALLLGLGGPATASPAENTLSTSSPANGAILESPPTRIVLTFALEIGDESQFDLSCSAEPIGLGDIEFGDDGRSMSTDLTGIAVPGGACSIRWATTDDDGVANGAGNLTFSLQTGTASTVPTIDDAGDTTPATTVASTADSSSEGTALAEGEVDALSRTTESNASVFMGRLLSTVGIALLFGALVTITAAWPEGVEYLVTIRFIRGVWILAMVGTFLFTAAAAGSVTGEGFGAGLNPASWIDLIDSDWAGRVVLLRFVLVAASAWVAFRPDRVLDPVTQLSALGIPALATATVGISRTLGELAILTSLLGVVHALAMAVWFGGVVLVARVVLAGPGEEDLVHAVRGFGRISVVAMVVTIASGVALMIRLDGGALLDAGHGRLLLLKAVIVAVMIFLAVTARQFVAQRVARAHEMSIPLADRLRRAFGAEAGIGATTMLLSAWLLALAPPNIDTTPQIAYDIRAEPFVDATSGLNVELRITDAQVDVPAGIEVTVVGPEIGLTSLAVEFIAPDEGTAAPGISQSVPLTSPGRAVRTADVGIPFSVAGEWSVQVRAVVAGTPVLTEAQGLNVLQADGTVLETIVTLPTATVVTIAPTDSEPDG